MEEFWKFITDHSLSERDHKWDIIDRNILEILSIEEIKKILNLPNDSSTNQKLQMHLDGLKHNDHFFIKNLSINQREKWILPTSSSNLNSLLVNNGLNSGEIVLIYGKARSGKTQFAHFICIQVFLKFHLSQNDMQILYIDSENTFRPERIIEMIEPLNIDYNNIMKRINVMSISSEQEFILSLKKLPSLMKNSNYKLIVVDSLTIMFRLALARDPKEFMLILSNFSQALYNLKKIAVENNIPIVCTSQVTASFDKSYFFDVIPILGSILNQYIKTWLLFVNSEEILDQSEKESRRYAHLVNSNSIEEKIVQFKIAKTGIEDYF